MAKGFGKTEPKKLIFKEPPTLEKLLKGGKQFRSYIIIKDIYHIEICAIKYTRRYGYNIMEAMLYKAIFQLTDSQREWFLSQSFKHILPLNLDYISSSVAWQKAQLNSPQRVEYYPEDELNDEDLAWDDELREQMQEPDGEDLDRVRYLLDNGGAMTKDFWLDSSTL